jgi:hypothetical protein
MAELAAARANAAEHGAGNTLGQALPTAGRGEVGTALLEGLLFDLV